MMHETSGRSGVSIGAVRTALRDVLDGPVVRSKAGPGQAMTEDVHPGDGYLTADQEGQDWRRPRRSDAADALRGRHLARGYLRELRLEVRPSGRTCHELRDDLGTVGRQLVQLLPEGRDGIGPLRL